MGWCQNSGALKKHHGAPGKNAPDSKQSPSAMSHSLIAWLTSDPSLMECIHTGSWSRRSARAAVSASNLFLLHCSLF